MHVRTLSSPVSPVSPSVSLFSLLIICFSFHFSFFVSLLLFSSLCFCVACTVLCCAVLCCCGCFWRRLTRHMCMSFFFFYSFFCLFLCVACVGEGGRETVCTFKTLPMCPFKTPPVCTGTTSACGNTCGLGANTHGDKGFSACHPTHYTTPHHTAHIPQPQPQPQPHTTTTHNDTQRHTTNPPAAQFV